MPLFIAILLGLVVVGCGSDKLPFFKKKPKKVETVQSSEDACVDAAIVANMSKEIAAYGEEILLKVSAAKGSLLKHGELADKIEDSAREAQKDLAGLRSDVIIRELRESECVKPKTLTIAEKIKKVAKRWRDKVKELLKQGKEAIK